MLQTSSSRSCGRHFTTAPYFAHGTQVLTRFSRLSWLPLLDGAFVDDVGLRVIRELTNPKPDEGSEGEVLGLVWGSGARV